jgi:hypothetical protein
VPEQAQEQVPAAAEEALVPARVLEPGEAREPELAPVAELARVPAAAEVALEPAQALERVPAAEEAEPGRGAEVPAAGSPR